MPSPVTFGQARDSYLQRATLKSRHTVTSYGRAIALFMEFLSDASAPSRILPIMHSRTTTLADTPVSALSEADSPILLYFVQWLLSPPSDKAGDKRPYKPATVQLRLAGVQNWFQFMDDHGWLPADFPLAKARRIVRDELRGQSRHSGPPEPPPNIEEVIYFYDNLKPPRRLAEPDAPAEQRERWELTRLRNCALLHALAESGGRVSEVLSLNLDDFPERFLQRDDVLRVAVRGKGGHVYHLRFHDALPVIRAYIERRGPALRATRAGKVPLFVSHDPRFDGARMSRIVAWRVVQRAARALGLGSITPHDFRHWRATQLLNAGYPLDVVQDYLGHRSVETTRAYYAHTDPLRVDDAARSVGLPRLPDDDLQPG
ncbi:MAG: tyrosine-type recombinase/integrase [Anaerolineae bacterium]|nr:tyrosine-type recombinase/integrase [Anaerolineae bacterium]